MAAKSEQSQRPRVTTKLISYFLRHNVDPRSVLVTDYWPGYNEVRDWMQHLCINHSVEYVDGPIHTNTIEGFWALVKGRSPANIITTPSNHAAMYINGASYKYNTRRSETPWDDFMLRACGVG